MIQKVHSVSYLAKAEFELNTGVHDLVALPAGAEVVKVSLEVKGAVNAMVNVGFKDASTKNYFLGVVLENGKIKEHVGIEGLNTITSARDYTATRNKVVVADVKDSTSGQSGDARGILRVVYFLPSVIEVEY
ncbi:hypothetical protein Taitung52_11380 [Helicobacter pylori]